MESYGALAYDAMPCHVHALEGQDGGDTSLAGNRSYQTAIISENYRAEVTFAYCSECQKATVLQALRNATDRLAKAAEILNNEAYWKKAYAMGSVGSVKVNNGFAITRMADTEAIRLLNAKGDIEHHKAKINELLRTLQSSDSTIHIWSTGYSPARDVRAYVNTYTPFVVGRYIHLTPNFWTLPHTGMEGQYGNSGGQDVVVLHELARYFAGYTGDDLTGEKTDVFVFNSVVNYLNWVYEDVKR